MRRLLNVILLSPFVAATLSAGPPPLLIRGGQLTPQAGERVIDATDRVVAPHLIVQMIKDAGPLIGVIVNAMTEADMAAILVNDGVLICSDGEMEGRHPRGYGAFPRVLADFVRQKQIVSLENAIAKMTSRSARRLGLTDRGTVAVGKKADVVVFDPGTIADRGTPENPAQSPVGIDYVIVNGEEVLDRGTMTSARPGRALKHSQGN